MDSWLNEGNNICFKTYFFTAGNSCLICDGCRDLLKDADPLKESNFVLMRDTNLFKNDRLKRCSCCNRENIYSQHRFKKASLYGDINYNFIRDLEGEKSYINGDNLNGSIYSYVEYNTFIKFVNFLINSFSAFT